MTPTIFTLTVLESALSLQSVTTKVLDNVDTALLKIKCENTASSLIQCTNEFCRKGSVNMIWINKNRLKKRKPNDCVNIFFICLFLLYKAQKSAALTQAAKQQ